MRRVWFLLIPAMLLIIVGHASTQGLPGPPLSDSPGALLQGKGVAQKPVPCSAAGGMPSSHPEAVSAQEIRTPCTVSMNPYRPFLDNETPFPLTPKQKGYLAVRDVIDPFNLLTITGTSAFAIGVDSHSAYGPGLRGFGRNVGDSLLQDVTGEFIGTFAVCSLLHEDPHYHRMPDGRPWQRIRHALKHTLIAQHDDGRPMLNYENLITYPASAEIANLYVPGIGVNGPSTIARILTGLATDPAGNLITEFLPDFARRVHVRVVFVQQIINRVAHEPPP